MRLVLSRVGGLAALQRPPRTVDTAALPADKAAELHDLVHRAVFFDLPPELGTATPDATGHVLTISDGDREHTVSFDHPSAPAPLRELVSALNALPR
ncbi:MAG TPA: protealysin inhibitor emfourin [Myxococcales bacterium]|nr:protealysin inhibitor emfourin [Myxococcales bacterium]